MSALIPVVGDEPGFESLVRQEFRRQIREGAVAKIIGDAINDARLEAANRPSARASAKRRR